MWYGRGFKEGIDMKLVVKNRNVAGKGEVREVFLKGGSAMTGEDLFVGNADVRKDSGWDTSRGQHQQAWSFNGEGIFEGVRVRNAGTRSKMISEVVRKFRQKEEGEG
tara:strand:- start:46 stop:366 length:321 start_codon:yes stop_codon:yes gene_type:complete